MRRRAPDTPDKIKVTNKSEPKDWAEGELEDIEQPDNISVDDFDLLAEQFCELNIVSKESLKKMFVTTERLQQEFFFPTPCRYDAAKRIDRDDGSLQDPDHHRATFNDSHTKPLAIDWDCNKDVARTLKRKQKQKEKQGDEYKYDYKDFPGRYGEWKNCLKPEEFRDCLIALGFSVGRDKQGENNFQCILSIVDPKDPR